MTTTYDFNDGNGPVPANRHPNGGGWVADSAYVEDTAYVGPDAKVYGNAKVYDNAKVSGDAEVYGNAFIFGSAKVSGNTWVSGYAGYAKISSNAEVTKGSLEYSTTDNKQELTPEDEIHITMTLDIKTEKKFDQVMINGVKYVKET